MKLARKRTYPWWWYHANFYQRVEHLIVLSPRHFRMLVLLCARDGNGSPERRAILLHVLKAKSRLNQFLERNGFKRLAYLVSRSCNCPWGSGMKATADLRPRNLWPLNAPRG